jgi:hypothetical protein
MGADVRQDQLALHATMAFEEVRTAARFVFLDESPTTRRDSAGPLEIGEHLIVIEVGSKVTS